MEPQPHRVATSCMQNLPQENDDTPTGRLSSVRQLDNLKFAAGNQISYFSWQFEGIKLILIFTDI